MTATAYSSPRGSARYLFNARTVYLDMNKKIRSQNMQHVKLEDIQQIVGNVIGDPNRAAQLEEHSNLLGALPELDSMGVVNLMLGLEERYGFRVEDEELEIEVFETLGTFLAFAQMKLDAS